MIGSSSSSSPSSYSHFYVGSMYDDIRLHVARLYTSSADSSFSLISSFTLTNHLLLGLPLFLLPCTFITIALLPTQCSSLLITCPYHFDLLSWTFFVIPYTFVVPLILSFLILSSFVTPHSHRSILISATSDLFSCAFFNAHVYAPYISAGLTTVLYTFPLIALIYCCQTAFIPTFPCLNVFSFCINLSALAYIHSSLSTHRYYF